jgi:hypothetical protein
MLPKSFRPQLEALEDRLVPSANPQQTYMLELMNQMRANPTAALTTLFNSNDQALNNDISYFKIDKQALAQAFSALKPAAPLAWNDQLLSSAFGHSELMLQDNQQAHVLPGEADIGTRIARTGYQASTWAENIYAYAKDVFEAFGAFAIDWGNPAHGHRDNIMNSTLREVGIGIVNSVPGKSVGPLLITQDFGAQFNEQPYLLGVVSNDSSNDSGVSTQGQGMAGVNITVTGSAGTYHQTTNASGWYQLQLPAGTYTVTASGGALGAARTKTVTIGNANVELDFSPKDAMAPTGPTGPTAPTSGTKTTVAVYDLSNGNWFLNNGDAGNPNPIRFNFGFGGTQPVAGNWQGDGVSRVGVYQASTGRWYLGHHTAAGDSAPTTFQFGFAGTLPVAGDWLGDGVDRVGIYNPATGVWYLDRNIGAGDSHPITFQFGFAGTLPVVGNFFGDGRIHVGVYQPSTGMWYIDRNINAGDSHPVTFQFGFAGTMPVAGDWLGDGHVRVGIYNPATGVWYLDHNVNRGDASPITFQYGYRGTAPVAGVWQK